MANRPSDIVKLYRTASSAAHRIGQKYVLDERRLESMFSQAQIDGIFSEIEYIDGLELLIKARLSALDALPTGAPDA